MNELRDVEYVSDCYMVVTQVHDLLHFFPPSGSQLSFVWGSSSESGFMHVYLVTVSLEPSVSETSLAMCLPRESKKLHHFIIE